MRKKRTVIIICILLFIILLFVGCHGFITWLDDSPPEIPRNSSSNKIILASEGCCFLATDVTVAFLEECGNKTIVIFKEEVWWLDIFEYRRRDIPEIDAPINVLIDFTSHYGNVERVSLIVGDFSCSNDLLRRGLLLLFLDGELLICDGNNRTLFRHGAFNRDSYGDYWFQEHSHNR